MTPNPSTPELVLDPRPERPVSQRARTFDPIDDVFGYAETKRYIDALERENDFRKKHSESQFKQIKEWMRISDEAIAELKTLRESNATHIESVKKWEAEAQRLGQINAQLTTVGKPLLARLDGDVDYDDSEMKEVFRDALASAEDRMV